MLSQNIFEPKMKPTTEKNVAKKSISKKILSQKSIMNLSQSKKCFVGVISPAQAIVEDT